MEDFANLLQRDYGLKPQGKMAPMSAVSKGKGATTSSSSNSNRGGRAASSSFPPDEDLFFGSSSRPRNGPTEPAGAASYDDVFGGPPKFTPPKPSSSSSTMPVYDDIFRTQPVPNAAPSNDHSFPVFDDDIFVGVPGTRRNSMPDSIFGGGAASNSNSDDLLGGFAESKASAREDSPAYDDELLPGLGSGRSKASAPRERSSSVEEVPQDSADVDPFGDLPSVDPFVGIPPAAAGFSVNGNGTDNGFDGFDIFSQPRPRSKKPPPPSYKENAGVKSDEQSTSGGREAGVSESFHADQEAVSEVPADSEEDLSQPQAYDSRQGYDTRQGWITIDDVRLLTEPSPSPAPLRPPPGFMRDKETTNGDFSDAQQQFDEEILAREKEERRLKEERERERQRREQERIAVERVTREAHERAFREAREKGERIAAEKVAEEARSRLAAEAKQKAEDAKQAAEAKKKAQERAAVERAAREARARLERAARENVEKERERAAAVAADVRRRSQEDVARQYQEQQRNRTAPDRSSADDLDIFGTRPSSAPKQRPDMADARPASQDRRSSSSTPVRKVSSASGIDELNFFDASFPPAGPGAQDETADRMKARLEREKRIRERQKQALMEKHQRDVDAQKEQAEKERAAETVDAEIKRWAAGKEGNIRALLSTLQYVLWPECGWQPVGLTDLITGASVKKAYRMASLRLHPDKVQKAATVQQKYIAEKVFDLLKEAWNKFNSEELF